MNLGVIDSILCLLCANFRFMNDYGRAGRGFLNQQHVELFFFGPFWVTAYSSV